jgi:ABC-2 type transport system ATP-binding protein
MIACRSVTKNYGTLTALSDASFAVAKGSVCAVLGPNGAGKSTLVKILTGLLKATSGSAEVCGVSSGDAGLKKIVGILPESLALFNELTVGEHLELTGAVYKIEKHETARRTEQLLRVLRLEHGRQTFIRECSYGMKKKTALAMALLPNPRALFLDEPFEGIDPVTAETIRLLLRTTAERGVTILLTSHILSLVDKVADQVVMINHGKIALDKQVGELPQGLEELYFDLVERATVEDLGWLGSHA